MAPTPAVETHETKSTAVLEPSAGNVAEHCSLLVTMDGTIKSLSQRLDLISEKRDMNNAIMDLCKEQTQSDIEKIKTDTIMALNEFLAKYTSRQVEPTGTTQ
jgi:hypothetical protein